MHNKCSPMLHVTVSIIASGLTYQIKSACVYCTVNSDQFDPIRSINRQPLTLYSPQGQFGANIVLWKDTAYDADCAPSCHTETHPEHAFAVNMWLHTVRHTSLHHDVQRSNTKGQHCSNYVHWEECGFLQQERNQNAEVRAKKEDMRTATHPSTNVVLPENFPQHTCPRSWSSQE